MGARSSAIEQIFEVRVKEHGQIKMLHFLARNHHKAVERAKQSGYSVVRANHLDMEKLLGNIEQLSLDNTLPHHSALAVEERAMNRRKRRLADRQKHEQSY